MGEGKTNRSSYISPIRPIVLQLRNHLLLCDGLASIYLLLLEVSEGIVSDSPGARDKVDGPPDGACLDGELADGLGVVGHGVIGMERRGLERRVSSQRFD